MSKSLSATLEVEGFEDPFFIEVDIKGFDDSIIFLEKIGALSKPLVMKVTIKGHESKVLKVLTEPSR